MSVLFHVSSPLGLSRLGRSCRPVSAFTRGVRPGATTNSPRSFQNCTTTQVATPTTITNIGTLAIPTSATSAAISAAIGNVSTAFLTQQGSAFVSAPANPLPDQPGGGVWARGVGGQANLSSTSNSVGISTQGGAVDQYRDHQLQQSAAPDLRRRAGRHRHRTSQL